MAASDFRPLVAGFVAGGGWEYVRAWVMTLRDCGYSGEAVLMTAGCEGSLSEQCARWDVTTVETDPAALATRYITDAYNGRHALLARMLEERYPDHFVLACDTRDIVFQTDPFEFFRSSENADEGRLHVVSEEVAFDQEGTSAGRWGGAKVAQLFSERERAELRGLPVYNIGVLGGPAPLVAGMQRMVHLMCFNSRAKVTDQAAMNFIMRTEPWPAHIACHDLRDGWTVHYAGVKLGRLPAAIAPKIEDELVKTVDGRPFSIVHQYDRARRLRALVEKRVGPPESSDVTAEAT